MQVDSPQEKNIDQKTKDVANRWVSALVGRPVTAIVSIGIIIFIIVELSRKDEVAIDNLIMPSELTEAGMTGEVLARQIVRAYKDIALAARGFVDADNVEFSFSEDESFDVVIQDISVRSAIHYIKRKLGLESEKLYGSLVKDGKDQFSLIILAPFDDNLPWDVQIKKTRWVFKTDDIPQDQRESGYVGLINYLAKAAAEELMRVSQPEILATHCVRRYEIRIATLGAEGTGIENERCASLDLLTAVNLAVDETSSSTHLWPQYLRARLYLVIGKAFKKQHFLLEAEHEMLRLIERANFPGSGRPQAAAFAHKQLGDIRYESAMLMRKIQKNKSEDERAKLFSGHKNYLELAEESYNRALDVNADKRASFLAPMYNGLGKVKKKQTELDIAGEYFSKATQINKDYEWAHLQLSELALLQCNFGEVGVSAKAALTRNPYLASGHYYLGLAAFGNEQCENGKARFARAQILDVTRKGSLRPAELKLITSCLSQSCAAADVIAKHCLPKYREDFKAFPDESYPYAYPGCEQPSLTLGEDETRYE